ncbi:MAG: HAMP domain-containing histidine kinase [Thermogemmatispora sp.]|uniref:sensor histidine kinase n=1 Tax=Thermogemmatispora sp. TaxID=1968838 RepID=UPI002623E2F9|nr:HAMP domain-containing sensor histidine kinase [Thermogemmatispora sp.]MBX5459000.1 HAMP domain-containing histidine kinase [Thermogemmatispora sp.]
MSTERDSAPDHALEGDERSRLQDRQETEGSGSLTLSDLPLARIAHELRAPLNRISGFLDLLLAEEEAAGAVIPASSELSPQFRDYLQRARVSSEQLYLLLENLLCLLRAASGQLRLSSGVIAVEELIESAVEELEYTARLRQLRIEKRFARELLAHRRRIRTDSQRARQILRNVLANACTYTPVGGQITIEAAAVSLPSGLPGLALSIGDSGVGIRPEVLPHIFEPFYRAEPPAGSDQLLESSGSGLGLGLSVSHLLVEQLGGTITVQSAPGVGTTVSITLPTLT